MSVSEQLNRLREMKAKILNQSGSEQQLPETSPTASAVTAAVQTSAQAPTPPQTQVTPNRNMPQTLDASFVITPETKYDEWGMPIVTPKDIKNGLLKMREQPNAEVTTTKSAGAESIDNNQQQTDAFGVPI